MAATAFMPPAAARPAFLGQPLAPIAPALAQQQAQAAKKPDDFKVPDTVVFAKLDKEGNTVVSRFNKGRLLGKGGFARCFKFVNADNNHVLAGKVIDKKSLDKARAQHKLEAEIKIHRSLRHRYIVGFDTYFEDVDNVYIMLEICPNQTLMEWVKRRRSISEPETALLLLQLLDAMRYLHFNNIIHRDLKLGNLFVSKEMEVRVGDFGLATQLERRDERRKTVCGTPNYIAPEILEGKNGHSFEVDTWAFGVILYTMLIGKPPFETADVKSTYKKIRENSYSFPAEVRVSHAAKDLITRILVPNPAERPTLDDIARHPFFLSQMIPRALPSASLTEKPVFGAEDLVSGELYVRQLLARPLGGLIYRSRSQQAAAAAAASGEVMHRAHSAPDMRPHNNPQDQAGSGAGYYQAASTANAHWAAATRVMDKENEQHATGFKSGAGVVGTSARSVSLSDAASVAPNDLAALGARGLHLDTASQGGGGAGTGRDSVASGSNGSGQESGTNPGSADSPWLVGLQSTHSVGFTTNRPGSAPLGPPAGQAQRPVQLMRPSSAGVENGSATEFSKEFGRGVGQAAVGQGVANTEARRVGVPLWTAPAPAPGRAAVLSSGFGGPQTTAHGQSVAARVPLRPLSAVQPPSTAPQHSYQPSFQLYNDADGELSPGAGIGRQPVHSSNNNVDVAMSSSPRAHAVPHSYQQQQADGPARDAQSGGMQLVSTSPSAPALPGPAVAPAVNNTLHTLYDGITSAEDAAENRRVGGLADMGRTFAGLSLASGTTGLTGPRALLSADKTGVWVTCWIDVTSKYGLGYLLSNGCVGVCFNDATKIVASPDGERFEYIDRQSRELRSTAAAAMAAGRSPGAGLVVGADGTLRHSSSVATYPPELKKKVLLLRLFRQQLVDFYGRRQAMTEGHIGAAQALQFPQTGIFGSTPATPAASTPPPAHCPAIPIGDDEALAMSAGGAMSSAMPAGSLPYLRKWVKTRRALMFQLSTHAVQVYFLDGHSVVLEGRAVTYVDPEGRRAAFTLASLFEAASPALPPFGTERVAGSGSPRLPHAVFSVGQEAVDNVVQRVKYAQNVLSGLIAHPQR